MKSNSDDAYSLIVKDILVLGTNIAGLASALAYARVGLSVFLTSPKSVLSVDLGKEDKIDQDVVSNLWGQALNNTRSMILNPRALELLAALGVIEDVLRAGQKLSDFTIRDASYQKIASFGCQHLKDRPYAFFVSLPEAVLEKILIDHLNKYGVEIHWGLAWSEQTLKNQDEFGVSILKSSSSNDSDPMAEVKVSASLIVVAEGPVSLIKKALKIGTGLTEYEHRWHYASLRSELDYGDFNICLFAQGFLALQKIKQNNLSPAHRAYYYRLISTQRNPHTLLPQRVSPEELLWQSEVRLTHRQTRSYQYGRLFFVGECAHQHFSMLGHELSLSLEDAVTLAAMTLSGCLDQYHDHRYRLNLKALYETERLFNFLQPHSKNLDKARNFLLKNLFARPFFQSKILRGLSGC